jgi:hypothetical protein
MHNNSPPCGILLPCSHTPIDVGLLSTWHLWAAVPWPVLPFHHDTIT